MLCNPTDVIITTDCEEDELCYVEECCLGAESC
jgi:hypothetical protein